MMSLQLKRHHRRFFLVLTATFIEFSSRFQNQKFSERVWLTPQNFGNREREKMTNQGSYGSVEYWNEIYSGAEYHMDWYTGYSNDIRNLFKCNANPMDNILHVGCGNSLMAENMILDGYYCIYNIDNSQIVINMMQRKYGVNGRLIFHKMDVKSMQFQDGYFDVIIDKALFDTFLCDERSSDNVQEYLGEVQRILKPNGKFIMISNSPPEERLEYFDGKKSNWSVETQPIAKEYSSLCPSYGSSPYIYAYIVTKL